jgi:methionyl-tRNA formyltransferase
MKIIFLGTPSFAATVLSALIASRHTVAAVITQPDRIAARGGKVVPSPVKHIAAASGIPTFAFEKISREGVDTLKSVGADIMVTAAYGQILSQEVLDITKHGVLNVHGSLLPKYRGASPVQSALLAGDTEVGVTIMQTVLEVDAGDMLLKRAITLDGTENAAETLEKLAAIGGEAIVDALDLLEAGEAQFEKQDASLATFSKMLKKEDGLIDFNKSAREIVNFVRAMNPWPSAYINTKYGTIKILRAEVVAGEAPKQSQSAGEVLGASAKQGLIIATADGAISVVSLKAEGGKEMSARDFVCGKPFAAGTVL